MTIGWKRGVFRPPFPAPLATPHLLVSTGNTSLGGRDPLVKVDGNLTLMDERLANMTPWGA